MEYGRLPRHGGGAARCRDCDTDDRSLPVFLEELSVVNSGHPRVEGRQRVVCQEKWRRLTLSVKRESAMLARDRQSRIELGILYSMSALPPVRY